MLSMPVHMQCRRGVLPFFFAAATTLHYLVCMNNDFTHMYVLCTGVLGTSDNFILLLTVTIWGSCPSSKCAGTFEEHFRDFTAVVALDDGFYISIAFSVKNIYFFAPLIGGNLIFTKKSITRFSFQLQPQLRGI